MNNLSCRVLPVEDNQDDYLIVRMNDAGSRSYLTKPLDVNEFLQVIEILCRKLPMGTPQSALSRLHRRAPGPRKHKN